MSALPARSPLPVADATPRPMLRLADQTLAGLRQPHEPAGYSQFMRLADAGAERRGHPRHVMHVRAEGRRLDHSPAAVRRPVVSLMIRDVSLGGVGATCQEPMGVGERVVLYFPPRGAKHGFDARGRVVRCQADRLGHRVGIAFDAAPMRE